ncbi:hypothetical protein CLAFUR0_14591 [Fulvia fulva]|nr:hypothetical protein CLAFUR0_14591 [Fulvia fulva]
MSASVYSISPSTNFKGNDGNWSTFTIQVGTPPTFLEVLPATSGRSIWVVHPQGCEFSDQPDGCQDARGGIFSPVAEVSSTWSNIGDANQFSDLNFGPEEPLNSALPTNSTYAGASVLGTDLVTFGSDGGSDAPELRLQFVAAYAERVPYLGVLGLSAFNETPINRNEPYSSPLGAWNSTDRVSSAYYGYTAGAHYRTEDDRLGSLVFGGYDASRRDLGRVVTVPFGAANTNRSLALTVQGITLTDISQAQAIDMQPLANVLIDSVVPEIWLPETICNSFETAFGLVWNSTARMYLVSDDQHNRLTTRNASVTFSLARNSTANSTAITLPYAALAPFAGYPLLEPVTNDATLQLRYFPLKRAESTNQYYLGRTFLQEAYLAVDYDREEFYVSPAKFGSGEPSLQQVHSPGRDNGPSGLRGGAIAGIVVGALAALALAGALGWWFGFKKHRQERRRRKSKSYGGTSSIGGTTIEAWQEGIPPGHVEHYKPAMSEVGSDQDQLKQELDATATARGSAAFHRHELSAGTIRRVSDQSRASISPLENRRSHYRSGSYGVPLPPSADQLGAPSPPLPGSEHPSPPLSSGTSWFGGPVELHGFSRGSPASPSTPAIEEVPPIQEGSQPADRNTLNHLEGSNA